MTVALLIMQLAAILAGMLGFSWWLHRVLPARWSTWGWGALAFVASQALRIPLLLGLTLAFRGVTGLGDTAQFWINLAILCLTSGLFEETSRYVVLRWLARDARSWEDGVMFGAGHGGIEAILVVGYGVANALVLLLLGDTLVEQARAVSPEQANVLAGQIFALRTMPWWTPLVSIWERAMAITFHIAASLVVLRAVTTRRLIWLWAAMAGHAAFNALALIVQRESGSIFMTELAVTAVALGCLWLIFRLRPKTTLPDSRMASSEG